MTITTRRRVLALATVALLATGLTACGDDDGDEAATGDTSGSASASASGADAELIEYCEQTAKIESAGEPDIDFESASEEEIQAAVKEFAGETMMPIARKIDEVAPAEVADDIDTLVASLEKVAETGDFGAFEDPETEAASQRAHQFDLDNCGWNVADVTAVDYAFEGVKPSYPAGTTSFEFSNEGEELHEFIVLRKKDDTSESFEELLELPEEEARQKVDSVASTFGEPGEEGVYTVADLQPGEYLGICFIPTGLTPEAAEAAEQGGAEPQGPPHFTKGMRVEFTVE